MGSTSKAEISLERPREADEPPSDSDPGDPPPIASNKKADVVVATVACTTCGKKDDHSASDCPYKHLLARASRAGSPPAPNRTYRVCPACGDYPDPGRRRWDGDSALRVTNLPDGTSERDLRRLFAPFGVVYRVSLSPQAEEEPAESSSPGRPVGIVQLDQVEDAEVAIGWLNGDVHGGLALGVEWAEPFVPPPICKSCLRRDDESGTCVRVANLSERTSERDLCNLCHPFGVIGSSHLLADEKEEAGSRRQVGVVEFDSRDAAEEAVSWLNGHVFDELELRVEGLLKL